MSKSLSPALRRTLLIGPLLLIPAACASPIQTPAISLSSQVPIACTAFSRISFDRLKDTDETIRQVKAYDAARDAVCGKGK